MAERESEVQHSEQAVGKGYSLPDGPDWYAYNVKRITTTNLTPAEIHQIGLDEVARIHNEMRGVMTEVGFEGDLKDFFNYLNSDDQFYFDTAEELIQGYRDMSERISELSKSLFNVFPKSSLEVRRIEPFREASAAAARTMTSAELDAASRARPSESPT